ncbi:hypothetical protein [Limnohabitans sp.]|uniref:hypothetical protein n=1 Tax=Limnohabitans sp. TaxID=1907725 RepID=UPI00286EBDCA|nr:hypothetical protein [Limnohabitans sp.]
MDVQLFLEYLPWLRSPKYFSTKLGLSSNYDDWLVKDTTPIKRAVPLILNDAPESVQKLYSENDLKNLNFIGGTFFWSEPKKLEQGWGFADMSEVNLVVAPSGCIEAYAAHPIRGMPGATDCLGVLAKDLESYLEALLCAGFNKTHFISGFPDEDSILFQKTVHVAKLCSLIAGGYEYYNFWAGLLGLPPTDTVPE